MTFEHPGGVYRVSNHGALGDDRVVAAQLKKTQAQRQVCLLVLGMHRSGTSALTRVLSIAGAKLPAELVGASSNNKAGYWEPRRFVDYNDRLLVEAGSAWHDWGRFDLTRLGPARRDAIKADLREIIAHDFGDAPFFVLKDPRVCRFAGLVMAALEVDGIIVAPVISLRNPLEVAASLAARNGMARADAALLWLRHVLDAEAATRNRPRAIVPYDRLLSDWPGQLQQIARALNLSFPNAADAIAPTINDFLKRTLRHHTHSAEDVVLDPVLRGWVSDVYSAMSVLAVTPNAEQALTKIDQVRQAFDGAESTLKALVSAAGDAVRAETTPQIAHLTARLSAAETERTSLQARAEGLAAQLTEKATALESQRAEAEAKAAENESRIAAAETRLAEAETKRTSLQARAEGLAAQLREKDAALESQRAEVEAKAKENESRIAAAETRLAAAEAKRTSLQARAEGLATQLREKDAALESQRAEAEAKATENESRIAAAETRAAALETENAAAKQVAAEMKAEHDKQAAERQAESARTRALEAQIRQKARETAAARSKANKALIAKAEQLHHMYQSSTSWKVTRPIRDAKQIATVVGQTTRQAIMSARTIPVAINFGGGVISTAAKSLRVYKEEGLRGIQHRIRFLQSADSSQITDQSHSDKTNSERQKMSDSAIALLRQGNYPEARRIWSNYYLKVESDPLYARQSIIAEANAQENDALFPIATKHPNWHKAPIKTLARYCVYTALFGNYDRLQPPLFKPNGVKFICFSDRACKVPGWEVRVLQDIDISKPILNSREPKILAHRFLKEYDATIYIDANKLIVGDIDLFTRKWLLGRPFVAWSHSRRSCAFVELETVLALCKARFKQAIDEYEHYTKSGLPRNAGLIEAAFLWRENANPSISMLMNRWWKEFANWSLRDQPLLCYLLWQHRTTICQLPRALGDAVNNDIFTTLPHLRSASENKISPPLPKRMKKNSKPARIKRIVFVYAAHAKHVASTKMRVFQLHELACSNCSETCEFQLAEENDIMSIRNSSLVLSKGVLKRVNPSALATLKRNNNLILADYVDDHFRLNLNPFIDIYIAASIRQLLHIRKIYPEKGCHLITHHADPRLSKCHANADDLRIGYFGELVNTKHTEELGHAIKFVSVDTKSSGNEWLNAIGDYNMHYAIRHSRNIDGFKPFLKGFTAAKTCANIITTIDEGDARFYLGSDYPYFAKSRSLSDVSAAIEHAEQTVGAVEWYEALEVMRSIRDRCSPRQIGMEIDQLVQRYF